MLYTQSDCVYIKTNMNNQIGIAMWFWSTALSVSPLAAQNKKENIYDEGSICPFHS